MSAIHPSAVSVGDRSSVTGGSESISVAVTGAKTPASFRPGGRRGFLGGSEGGFTLVEVAMAMGIIAFAFVSIFGLIPVGMTTFRRTMDVSVGSQIAQKVIGDAIETDFDTLTADSGYTRDTSNNVVPVNYTFRAKNPNPNVPAADSMWRYFDDQGNELTTKTGALYHVLTRVNPETPLPTSGSSNGLNTLAQITVQVVNNPGNKTIKLAEGNADSQDKPLRNLVDPKENLSVYTCTALIAKNK